MNKAVMKIAVATFMERRDLTERKSFNRSKTMTQSMEGLLPRLDRLGEMAKHNKTLQFNNLLHHLNLAMLTKAFYHLNKGAARGVDNMGWYDYQTDATRRLAALHQRIQSGRYKAQAVKRIWIPKGNGEERPIGVTAIEDKIVQQAVVWLLVPRFISPCDSGDNLFKPTKPYLCMSI